MKKNLVILLAMLMLLLSAGSAMAAGNGQGPSKDGRKAEVKTQENTLKQQAKDFLKQTKETLKTQQFEQKKALIQEKFSVNKELKQSIKAQIEQQKQAVSLARFKDTEKHWAAKSIDLLSAAGLFSGYPDGSFQPDNAITEAESISLVMRLTADVDEVQEEQATDGSLENDSQVEENTEGVLEDETIDADVDEESLAEVPEWARKSAEKAARKGFIKLNRFHSSVQATRAQTAVWVAKAIGLTPIDTSEMPFKDGLFISQEDVGYILALYKEGIIKGTPNGNFNPNSAITRAEMATIMEKILADQTIESITMQESATVKQGTSISLTATVNYADETTDNNVSWSSSNTALATVEDGVVTIAADLTGTVSITATAIKNGVSVSSTCELTIIAEDAPVTETDVDSETDLASEAETESQTDPTIEAETDTEPTTSIQ